MWQYRELIKNLTVADLKNKYQNTSLGFLWSILSPLLLAGILYLVFRNIFDQEQHFAVNLIVAIVAWRFFSFGTTTCLGCIVGRPSLVTKVYIPRQIITLSIALSSLISSVLEFLVLLPIIYVLLGTIPVTVALFPLFHILFFLLIYGIGLLLSALYVYLRDLNAIWELVMQILFFLSPIVYPVSIIKDPGLLRIYMFNPLTRLIIMYKDAMVSGSLPSLSSLLIVGISVVAALLIGTYTFERLQRRFAEAI